MHIHSLALQVSQLLRQQWKRFAATGIDADGSPLMPGFLQIKGNLPQQAGGKIVHAIIAAIFKNSERDAFTRPCQTANDDQSHTFDSRTRESCSESVPVLGRRTCHPAKLTSHAHRTVPGFPASFQFYSNFPFSISS